MSKLAQQYNQYLAPEAIVWINDEKLSKRNIFFNDLKVDMALDRADIFSFSIYDAINLEFELKNADLFKVGNTVEIHIGYADNTEEKANLPILFKGIISAITWSFSEENYLDIVVEGKDYSFLLMKHKSSDEGKQLTWNDTKDSDIVKKILTSTYSNIFSSAKVNIQETALTYNQVYYKEENDYAFISTLAKKNGYEFFVQKENFYFRKSPKIQKNTTNITLAYGKEILSFSLDYNIDKAVSKVKVFSIEFQNAKEKIVGEAPKSSPLQKSADTLGMKELLKSINNVEYEMKANVKSVDEANTFAEAKYGELSSSLIQAQLRCIGIPDLKPGISIQLKGLGKRFSTLYYVSNAVHTFNTRGYEVTMTLKSDATIFNKVLA